MMYDRTAGRSPHMTASRLKGERGWTEELIRERLGDPDRRAPNPHGRDAPPMRLYLLARVDRIVNADHELRVELARNARDAANRARRHAGMSRAEMIAEAASAVVTMRALPSERLEELVRLALENRRRYAEEAYGITEISPVDPDSPMARDLVIKMLRHQFTNYHELIERMPRTGDAETDASIQRIIWRRAIERIADAVPALAEECAELIEQRGA